MVRDLSGLDDLRRQDIRNGSRDKRHSIFQGPHGEELPRFQVYMPAILSKCDGTVPMFQESIQSLFSENWQLAPLYWLIS